MRGRDSEGRTQRETLSAKGQRGDRAERKTEERRNRGREGRKQRGTKWRQSGRQIGRETDREAEEETVGKIQSRKDIKRRDFLIQEI
jgi:hypothetical protein